VQENCSVHPDVCSAQQGVGDICDTILHGPQYCCIDTDCTSQNDHCVNRSLGTPGTCIPRSPTSPYCDGPTLHCPAGGADVACTPPNGGCQMAPSTCGDPSGCNSPGMGPSRFCCTDADCAPENQCTGRNGTQTGTCARRPPTCSGGIVQCPAAKC